MVVSRTRCRGGSPRQEAPGAVTGAVLSSGAALRAPPRADRAARHLSNIPTVSSDPLSVQSRYACDRSTRDAT
ncbi:hypothetical protein [Streptomyces sp. NPDC058326]|uniref:hypothetical protein n=1 Tax=Streptomyces sp. NPDC058326 TaxID=3346447 RepID=UPI0036EA30BB